jgi:hypothetical protein
MKIGISYVQLMEENALHFMFRSRKVNWVTWRSSIWTSESVNGLGFGYESETSHLFRFKSSIQIQFKISVQIWHSSGMFSMELINLYYLY